MVIVYVWALVQSAFRENDSFDRINQAVSSFIFVVAVCDEVAWLPLSGLAALWMGPFLACDFVVRD
jgi:hypothetical protein